MGCHLSVVSSSPNFSEAVSYTLQTGILNYESGFLNPIVAGKPVAMSRLTILLFYHEFLTKPTKSSAVTGCHAMIDKQAARMQCRI